MFIFPKFFQCTFNICHTRLIRIMFIKLHRHLIQPDYNVENNFNNKASSSSRLSQLRQQASRRNLVMLIKEYYW